MSRRAPQQQNRDPFDDPFFRDPLANMGMGSMMGNMNQMMNGMFNDPFFSGMPTAARPAGQVKPENALRKVCIPRT
jgi:hypothetical protein